MAELNNPSEASLQEQPETDFSKVQFVGRGLYTHLRTGDEVDDVHNHSGRFVVRIPKTLHRALANAAAENGVSLNMFVATALAHTIGSTQSRG